MKVIPIETVVDINDKSIRWADLYPYNGYQISITGLIRSMKFYKKFTENVYSYEELNSTESIEQDLQELIQEHQAIVTDLLAGYKKSELQLKYINFDTKLRHIQEIVRGLYNSQGTSIEAVLGVKK